MIAGDLQRSYFTTQTITTLLRLYPAIAILCIADICMLASPCLARRPLHSPHRNAPSTVIWNRIPIIQARNRRWISGRRLGAKPSTYTFRGPSPTKNADRSDRYFIRDSRGATGAHVGGHVAVASGTAG